MARSIIVSCRTGFGKKVKRNGNHSVLKHVSTYGSSFTGSEILVPGRSGLAPPFLTVKLEIKENILHYTHPVLPHYTSYILVAE